MSYRDHIYIEILLFIWKVMVELYYQRLKYAYDLWIHHSLFIFSTYYTLFIKPEYLFLLSISQIIHVPLMFYYLYKQTNEIRYLKIYKYSWPLTYYRDYRILCSYYDTGYFILLPIGILLLLLDIKWTDFKYYNIYI